MLEVRALSQFVTLADILHFGRAAERLGVTQSVLSVTIRRLEDTLNTTLFDRGGRASVRLTRAGMIFLSEARAALDRVDQAARIGVLAGRGEAGPLNVGYVFSAAMSGVLPDLLAKIHTRFPLLNVRPVQMETPEQLAALVDGRLDMGLIRSRPVYPAPVATRIVHEEPLMLALSPRHPLATAATIRPQDLSGQCFIMPQFRDHSGFVDHLESLARRGKFHLDDICSTDDFVSALSLAAGGYGIVLAPRSLAKLEIPGIIYRPIADHDDRVTLTLAWRADDPFAALAVVLDTVGVPESRLALD